MDVTAGAIPALVLLATLVVGLIAWRSTRNAADYFVAGRRLGPIRAGLATSASAFSGFVFLGGPGLFHEIGVGSLFLVAPVGFTAALLCRAVGRRLALIAEATGAKTLPEAIRFGIGDGAPPALAAASILAGCAIYLGTQVLALGIAIRFAFGAESLLPCLLLGLGVLLAYSLAGGMVASVNTDVLQAVVMAAAAVAAFVWALGYVGGLGEATATLAGSVDAAPLIEPLGVLPAKTAFGFFLLFGIGALGQPHMLHKFLMLRRPEAMRFLPAVVGGAQSLSLLVWIGLGLAAAVLTARGGLGPLDRPDDAALSLLALPDVPALLAGLVAAAVLAAILSTSDAFVNLGAAVLARDLPRALGRSGEAGLRTARAATLLVGLLALGAALLHERGGGLVALLGTLGFGVFAVGLAPTLVLGLGWRRATPRAATASMVSGLVLLPVLEIAPPAALDGVPAAAVALCLAFAVFFVVGAAWPGPAPRVRPPKAL